MRGVGDQEDPERPGLSARQREQALARYRALRPHLLDGITLPKVAEMSAAAGGGPALRTLERWLNRYRAGGLAAPAWPVRADVMRMPLRACPTAPSAGAAQGRGIWVGRRARFSPTRSSCTNGSRLSPHECRSRHRVEILAAYSERHQGRGISVYG